MTCIGKFDRDFRIECISKKGAFIDIKEGWDWPDFMPVRVYMNYSAGSFQRIPWHVRKVHYIQKDMMVPSYAMIHGGCWFEMYKKHGVLENDLSK